MSVIIVCGEQLEVDSFKFELLQEARSCPRQHKRERERERKGERGRLGGGGHNMTQPPALSTAPENYSERHSLQSLDHIVIIYQESLSWSN